jgi:hypothetical protein
MKNTMTIKRKKSPTNSFSRTFWFGAVILILNISLNSCNQTEIDEEKPQIDLTIADAFPVNCDTLYFGEDFSFTALLRDNVELGSYSIDIHNNFDHHSHSTEVTACELWPVKVPLNPFVFIDDFDIPAGSTEFKTNQIISIPTSNGNGEFDEGDYHFYISLTDKEGWSTQKGLSIKIIKRK